MSQNSARVLPGMVDVIAESLHRVGMFLLLTV